MQAPLSLAPLSAVRGAAALCGLLAGLVGSRPAAQAQETFPYVAYVQSPQADVRSGPRADDYVTGRLPAGFAVEVYRHDAEGSCAIRPPAGSYSLVPAQALRMLDARTAEVIGNEVPARVGSPQHEPQSAVQVLLQKGERVELLAANPAEAWTRVAPPAGEFRWIGARALTRTPPTETGGASPPASGGAGGWRAQAPQRSFAGSSSTANRSSLLPETAAPHAAVVPTSATNLLEALHLVQGSPAAAQWGLIQQLQYQQPLAPPVMSGPGPQPAVPAGNPLTASAGVPSPLAAPPTLAPGGDLARRPVAATDAAAPPPLPAAEAAPRVRFRGADGEHGSGDPRLAELQLELSKIVVGAPREWRLDVLRQETAAVLARAESPELRAGLRDLLERIAIFEHVQRRYGGGELPPVQYAPAGMGWMPPPAAVAMTATPTPGTADPFSAPANAAEGAPLGEPSRGEPTGETLNVLARARADLAESLRGTASAPPATPPATEARYDAVGTLKPVFSRRKGAPRYALVDDRGAVVSFLSPAAELDLERFLGQRIGVHGARGFIPEFRQTHVTAGRVTPLEQPLRR